MTTFCTHASEIGLPATVKCAIKAMGAHPRLNDCAACTKREGTGDVPKTLAVEAPVVHAPLPVDPPAFSVILVARNEGAEVQATIDSITRAGAQEIIVVDDASNDGHCDNLPPHVQVVRNSAAAGVSGARNLGTAAASGKVLIFMDAHMRIVKGTLPDFAAKSIEYNCISCAASRPLRYEGEGGDWLKYGGHLAHHPSEARMNVVWNGGVPARDMAPLGAVVGACYAVPRHLLAQMGGWPPTRVYGYNEQAFSMAAWFCGIPMRMDKQIEASHRYRKSNPHPGGNLWWYRNGILIHWLMFSEGVWQDRHVPKLRASRKADLRAVERMVAAPEWQAKRADFQRRKVISDRDFYRLAVKPNSWGWPQ